MPSVDKPSFSMPSVDKPSFSMRIALALNSAVPDFGSTASMVSAFTSTSSGKCNVMNARPARNPSSIRTGATTAPRRDTTRTRSPSATPTVAASSGERSIVSPRRRGDENRPVCTPVLYESRRRPVVRRIGYASSSRSTGGEWCTTENGAGLPRSAGSALHRRPCRYGGSSECSFGHGHWMPPSVSSRS